MNGDGDAAAFSEQFGVAIDGSGKAGFFEQRRMKERRDEANFAHGSAGQGRGSADQLMKLTMAGGNEAADFGEGHF